MFNSIMLYNSFTEKWDISKAARVQKLVFKPNRHVVTLQKGRLYINVSYVMEFLAWWVLKSQVFAQKSTVVKWNCSILWIDIVWGLQKLGLILESKVVQKLSLEKNVFNKKWSPNWYF